MPDEVPPVGVNLSIADLHGIAGSLDSAAGGLHGHADTIAGIGLPVEAFGASEAVAAAFERHRRELEVALRHAGGRVEISASGVRTTAAGHAGNDTEGGAQIDALGTA